MNKIEELIKQLCPDGVEWKKLGDIVDTIVPPKKLKTIEYQNSGEYIIIDQGQNYIIGYTDDIDAILPLGEYVLYGDHTCIVKYVDKAFAQGADGLKILKSKGNNTKYIYYSLCSYNLNSSEYKRHWTQAKEIEIPLPPLRIQEEIVSILDKFVEQQEQLEKLIELRKKQYEYYREELLTPKEGWEKKTLGEIGTFVRGNGLQKTDFTEEGYPCIHYGQVHTYYGFTATKTKSFCDEDFAKKLKKAKYGDLIIATTSEDVEACCKATVWLGDKEVAISGDSYLFSHKEDPKFIGHLFKSKSFSAQKSMVATGAKVVRVSGESMAKQLTAEKNILGRNFYFVQVKYPAVYEF